MIDLGATIGGRRRRSDLDHRTGCIADDLSFAFGVRLPVPLGKQLQNLKGSEKKKIKTTVLTTLSKLRNQKSNSRSRRLLGVKAELN